MKIGLVCPYNMFEHRGGVQEIVVNIADGLRAKKHQVKIITPKPVGYDGALPENYIFLGISKRVNGALATSGDIAIEVSTGDIDQVLQREKFDVINFHEPWVPVLTRQIVMRSKNSAHVATFHANLADTNVTKSAVNLLSPYGRGITEKMHLLTATSPAPANVLINKYQGEALENLVKNLRYIPCGINLKYYHPLKKRTSLSGAGTKTIVYVGRPDKRKGSDWLLKAFAVLVAEMPEAHLIIAGAGSRLAVLKQYVASHKIPNVDFLGRVSDDRKRYLLGNADLACFPSLYGEGFGIVLVEAMAMGTPLLAGNNLGYQSVMKGAGRIGLINPEATGDFANRLAIFLNDDKVRKIMTSWSLNEVKQYDYPRIVDQYEAAYKEAHAIWRDRQQPKAEVKEVDEEPTKIVNRLPIRRYA